MSVNRGVFQQAGSFLGWLSHAALGFNRLGCWPFSRPSTQPIEISVPTAPISTACEPVSASLVIDHQTDVLAAVLVYAVDGCSESRTCQGEPPIPRRRSGMVLRPPLALMLVLLAIFTLVPHVAGAQEATPGGEASPATAPMLRVGDADLASGDIALSGPPRRTSPAAA